MIRYFLLLAALIAAFIFALGTGSQPIPAMRILDVLLHPISGTIDYQVIMQIRLPRVLLAALAGAALSTSGAAFQSLMRNPLADPYILGVSSGAAIGAVASLTLLGSTSPGLIGICAFAASAVTIAIVYWLGAGGATGQSGNDRMLLVGMAVSSFSASVLILFLGRSTGNDARAILHWLIGDVGGRSLGDLLWVSPVALALIGALVLLSHRFNLLALDPDAAAALGLDLRRHRRTGYLLASFLTASVVSLAGSIGFVGLVVPHVGRALFSSDCRALFPVSAVLGAALLVFADAIGRRFFAPVEVPVGVITALIGSPLFVSILFSRRRAASAGVKNV